MSKLKNRGFRLLWLLLLLSTVIKGQVQLADSIYYTEEDCEIFDRFLQTMEPRKELPPEQLIIEVAGFFLETPYVAATLEKEPEGLVINLREMDCATFVDNVIALSRMLKSEDHSFHHFWLQLQSLRYRGEEVGDYTDRLHYTSDWIYENSQRNIIQDINREIGGDTLQVDIHFMSTHPDSYKQLKDSAGLVEKIAAIENDINTRTYYYIPKQKINDHACRIMNGDIVCFTTAIKGLDISHTGIITRVEDKLTFIHASSLAKKVIINEESLTEYVNKGKNNTGIMLARPVGYSNNSNEILNPNRL